MVVPDFFVVFSGLFMKLNMRQLFWKDEYLFTAKTITACNLSNRVCGNCAGYKKKVCQPIVCIFGHVESEWNVIGKLYFRIWKWLLIHVPLAAIHFQSFQKVHNQAWSFATVTAAITIIAAWLFLHPAGIYFYPPNL